MNPGANWVEPIILQSNKLRNLNRILGSSRIQTQDLYGARL